MTDNRAKEKDGKPKARRARLWEDTIVISLRDAQWLRCLERYAEHQRKNEGGKPPPLIPQGLIKLDGRAESRLGDVSLGAGERFFIIEVKSSAAQIRDEWCSDGDFKPKQVYRRLAELVNDCNQMKPFDSDTPDGRLLMSSLRGHFVAFWVAGKDDPTAGRRVVLTPYVSAVFHSLPKDQPDAPGMIKQMPLSMAFALRSSNGHWAPATPIDLGHEDCHLTYTMDDRQIFDVEQPIGLSPNHFQSYIDFLCRHEPDTADGEPINAVMLSSHGSFFQVVSTTRELAAILAERFVEQPLRDRAPRQHDSSGPEQTKRSSEDREPG